MTIVRYLPRDTKRSVLVPCVRLVACLQLVACAATPNAPSGAGRDAGAPGQDGPGGTTQANPADAALAGSGATDTGDGGPGTTPDGGAPLAPPCTSADAQGASGLTPLASRHWSDPRVLDALASDPSVLDPGHVDFSGVDAAINPQGQVAVAWSDYDGARYHVWLARHDPDGDWLAPVQLDPPTPEGSAPVDRTTVAPGIVFPGDARFPQVFLAPNGEAFVSWQQTIDVLRPLPNVETWCSQGFAADGYSTPGPCPYAGPIGFDAESRALSVWASGNDVRLSRREPGADWQPPELIESSANSEIVDGLQFVVAANGDALLMWTRSGAVEVQARAYDLAAGPGSGLGALQTFPPPPHESIDQLALGLDACGGALALWRSSEITGLESGPGKSSRWIARRDHGTWSTSPTMAVPTAGPLSVLSNGVTMASDPLGGPLYVRRTDADWQPYDSGIGTQDAMFSAITARSDILVVAQARAPDRVMATRGPAADDQSVQRERLDTGLLRDVAANERGAAVVAYTDAEVPRELRVLLLQ